MQEDEFGVRQLIRVQVRQANANLQISWRILFTRVVLIFVSIIINKSTNHPHSEFLRPQRAAPLAAGSPVISPCLGHK